jgi:hypothetical protein
MSGDACRAALTELLRLYDWRNELGQIERDPNHDKKQMKASLNKYGREKKLAWAAAREALAAASAVSPQPFPYDGVVVHKGSSVGASGLDHEFKQKVAEAVARYESLSPVDKALHDSEQRRSWVRGETGRDPGDVLADEVRRLRDLLTGWTGYAWRKDGEYVDDIQQFFDGAKG